MKKISLVVPYYEVDSGKKELLNKMISSVSGYDELIIVWNQGMGFTRAVNKGYELAKGDFIVMACDDITFNNGNLKLLVDEKGVTSPHIEGRQEQDFWGTCWCTPRWVYEKIGMIPEEYAEGIYWEDEDYWKRCQANNIPLILNKTVTINHPHGGRTLELVGDRAIKNAKNKAVFDSFWNK